MAIDIFLREPAILSLHQLCTSFIKFKLSCQSPLLPLPLSSYYCEVCNFPGVHGQNTQIKHQIPLVSPRGVPPGQAVDMCITTTEFILPIIAGVHVNIFTQTLQTLGGNDHLLCYQEGNNLATTRFMMFIQELQIII